MNVLELYPTENQTFRLIGKRGTEGDLAQRLSESRRAEKEGDYERACDERYAAFQDIVALLPEEEPVELDYSHPNTQAAMEIIYGSAIDHYLIGDFEMAAAQAELLLDCDPEDRFGITSTLALCYVGLGEWECLEDIGMDIDDRTPLKPLLEVWASLLRDGKADDEALIRLRRHRAVVEEFCADDHPTDEAFMRDIYSEHPSAAAQARELWLHCLPLLNCHAEIVNCLKG